MFRKDLAKRNEEVKDKEAHGEKVKPHDETEAIANIYKRVDEIKEELKRELELELKKQNNLFL